MYVPCGKCDACLIQKSISRSSKLNVELSNYGKSLFVTLTYDNENIPFLVDGSKFLLRSKIIDGFKCVELLERFDYPVTLSINKRPNNWSGYVPDGINVVAVFYKKDYQKLLKLIRKYGNGNFIYYIKGEYGSFSKRPHFHILFRRDRGQNMSDIERLCIEYWKLCDWSAVGNDSIKYASKGVSSYLSSYVSSNISNYDVFLPKSFREFSRRSNNFDYGFNETCVSKIQSIIKREFGNEFFRFSEKDFRYATGATLNSFSFVLIPSDIYFAYFPKCQRYGDFSYNEFCLWTYRIFRMQQYKCRFGRFPQYEEELSSLDLTFFRAYKRVCFILKIKVFDFRNYDNYLKLHYKMSVFYNALLLKEQMKEWEILTPEDYLTTQYNTFSHNPSFNYVKRIYSQLGINHLLNSEFYTSQKKSKINDIIRSNHYKLLPKHLNSIIHKNSNL